MSQLCLLTLVRDLPRNGSPLWSGAVSRQELRSWPGTCPIFCTDESQGSWRPLVCRAPSLLGLITWTVSPLDFNGSHSRLTFFVTHFVIVTFSILITRFYGC